MNHAAGRTGDHNDISTASALHLSITKTEDHYLLSYVHSGKRPFSNVNAIRHGQHTRLPFCSRADTLVSASNCLIFNVYCFIIRKFMKFNTKKTVCMVFNPKVSRKIVANNFPAFTAGDEKLKFVDRFKYLGSIITEDLKDDDDIERELK